jgi:hypothetical protein
MPCLDLMEEYNSFLKKWKEEQDSKKKAELAELAVAKKQAYFACELKEQTESEGNLCLWIDQLFDPRIQQLGVNGVCNAMSQAWALSFQKGDVPYQEFCEDILSAQQEGPLCRVPKVYIEKQVELSKELKVKKEQVDILLKQYESEKTEDNKKKVREAFDPYKRMRYGSPTVLESEKDQECLDFVEKKLMPLLSGEKRVCCLLYLEKKGSDGHVIGFCYNPDYELDCMLFDTNLGLLAFPNVILMQLYFDSPVWEEFYKQIGYDTFKIAVFTN